MFKKLGSRILRPEEVKQRPNPDDIVENLGHLRNDINEALQSHYRGVDGEAHVDVDDYTTATIKTAITELENAGWTARLSHGDLGRSLMIKEKGVLDGNEKPTTP